MTSAIVRGRHNIKFGGEIRRIFVDVGEGNTTSLDVFQPAQLPGQSSRELQHRRFSRRRRDSAGGMLGYIQDDIKWRPNLTINAGLRYEYYSVVKEKDGRDKVWRMACGGFCAPGTPWYNPDCNNFAPRIGFAWTPARFKDNTVIRAGFGVFFGPGQNDDVFAPIDNAGSRTALERVAGADVVVSDRPVPRARRDRPAIAARAVDEHRVDQYAEHYSLSFQQALPWRFVGADRLRGNQGHHMLDRTYVNLIDPATGSRPLPHSGGSTSSRAARARTSTGCRCRCIVRSARAS